MIRPARQLKKARRVVRLQVIRRLDIQPGDVLVIRMQGQPEMGAMNRLTDLLGCKAVVLPADAKLGVVRVEVEARSIDLVFADHSLVNPFDLDASGAVFQPNDPPVVTIDRDAPCRNALARDGKSYPKSSCQRCGTLLRPGWKCAEGVGYL